MYAIVGIPGSNHHRWVWYHRSDSNRARQWASHTADKIRAWNPTIGTLPIRFMADHDAERITYRNGTQVYGYPRDGLPDTLPAIVDYEGHILSGPVEYRLETVRQ